MSHSLSELMVANEFIAAQKDDTLKRSFVEIIGNLRTKRRVTNETLRDTPLSEIVKKRTGMSITFCVDYSMDYNAFVSFYPTRLDTVLQNYTYVPDDYMEEYNKDIYADLKKKNHKLIGEIDIKNSKVSGIFSEFTADVYLGYDYFRSESVFTPAEASAVLLHELGHQFCNLMYTMEVVRTNMVLSSLNRVGYFNSNKSKKVEILVEMEKTTGLKFNEKDTIAISDDGLAYSVLIKDIFESPRSELKSSVMDIRTFEFISDQFATMHGAGGDLVSALQKLDKILGSTSTSTLLYRLLTFNNIIRPIIDIILLGALIGGGLLTAISVSVATIVFLTMSTLIITYDDMYYLYDKPLTRYRKVKEQLLSMLKDRTLSKERKTTILGDIARIDITIKTVRENPDLIRVLWDVFVPWLRKRQKLAKLQHDYETIVNSELFAKAARLETL